MCSGKGIFIWLTHETMKSIIVDDEQQSHEVLKKLLADGHPDIQVAACGYGIAEGLALIRKHRPQLVFIDIEMNDGTGFDLLEKYGQPDFHVIFITAHNEYAIRAIRFGALDYLLKPIAAGELADAIGRVRRQGGQPSSGQWQMTSESYRQLKNQELPTRMIISTSEGIHYIPIKDIIRLEADKTSTEIFYEQASKRLIASVHLGAYEEQFYPYAHFMRVHRGHIVNLLKVVQYVRGGNHLIVQGGDQVPVSRHCRDEVLKKLENL